MNHADKAGKEYWEENWASADINQVRDPRAPGLGNRGYREFHKLFKQLFKELQTKKELIEVGCAHSPWLPYFYSEFGFKITGLDYSKNGCASASALLARERTPGNILCADFFNPPSDLIGRFHVLASFGVVEHFKDTKACITALSRFLHPNGIMITSIPNMTGLIGSLQKIVNRDIYDIHVPMNREQLRAAHETNQLEVFSCDYFLSNEFWTVNPGQLNPASFRSVFGHRTVRCLGTVSRAIWALEEAGLKLPASRIFSPYIVCIAKRRAF